MDNYHQELEQRVWSRVHGSEDTDPVSALRAQIMEEATEIATHRMLLRQLPDREKALLRKLIDEELSAVARLRGIHLLITGKPPVLRTSPPPAEPPETALRKSYGKKLRLAAEYDAISGDSQYGHIFSALGQQAREHCHILLEILGNLHR